MRCIIVDPYSQTVYEKDITGDLDSIQAEVNGYIQAVGFDGIQLRDHHAYVDEEGLYKEEQAYWAILDSRWKENSFMGKAVFLCSTEDGDEAPATIDLQELRDLIWFV